MQPIFRKFWLLCLGIFLLFPQLATANLIIDDYTLVSKTRAGRTDYNYTFQAAVINNGSDLQNVTANLSSTDVHVFIVDEELSFGNVEAGETVSSNDTFTIRLNRRYSFDESALIWIDEEVKKK